MDIINEIVEDEYFAPAVAETIITVGETVVLPYLASAGIKATKTAVKLTQSLLKTYPNMFKRHHEPTLDAKSMMALRAATQLMKNGFIGSMKRKKKSKRGKKRSYRKKKRSYRKKKKSYRRRRY